jgi:hypothetical protein
MKFLVVMLIVVLVCFSFAQDVEGASSREDEDEMNEDGEEYDEGDEEDLEPDVEIEDEPKTKQKNSGGSREPLSGSEKKVETKKQDEKKSNVQVELENSPKEKKKEQVSEPTKTLESKAANLRLLEDQTKETKETNEEKSPQQKFTNFWGKVDQSCDITCRVLLGISGVSLIVFAAFILFGGFVLIRSKKTVTETQL